MPRYLEDKDSDFNDFESVASDQIKFYEPRYKAMMGNKAKNKEKIKFGVHKKHGSATFTSPASSSQGIAQFISGRSQNASLQEQLFKRNS